jgi:hypothetical protein
MVLDRGVKRVHGRIHVINRYLEGLSMHGRFWLPWQGDFEGGSPLLVDTIGAEVMVVPHWMSYCYPGYYLVLDG